MKYIFKHPFVTESLKDDHGRAARRQGYNVRRTILEKLPVLESHVHSQAALVVLEYASIPPNSPTKAIIVFIRH